jgi:hypothetical protein
MNKIKLAGVLLATTLAFGTGVLTACGTADDAKAQTGTSATADPTINHPETPTSPADLELSAGTAGPITVGMTKTEAAATGLFATDVASGVDGCKVHELAWTKPFDGTFDVQALRDGTVASIGVHKAGPKTDDGVGVGSSYADVLAAHPGAKAVEAGYGQTGVLVHDDATDGWIGYLFNAQVQSIADNDTVTFIELTNGEKPSLMRDGC